MKEKFSVNRIKEKKEKISVLTAYDYMTASIIDGEVDMILVGDSVGMVKLGYKNTLQVTMEDMIYHSKAVRRGTEKSYLVADMPYMSYHISIEETIRNAGRLVIEGGVDAVKLEGGSEVIDKVKSLINAKIPVIGHIGLTPQSVKLIGGYKIQGKSKEAIDKLLKDAIALEETGVIAVVIECVPEEVGKYITEKLNIPTIGIGSGRYCDGQVLVIDDMLGYSSEKMSKFVKKYEDFNDKIKKAVKKYSEEVKSGIFPDENHVFTLSEDEKDKLERLY